MSEGHGTEEDAKLVIQKAPIIQLSLREREVSNMIGSQLQSPSYRASLMN